MLLTLYTLSIILSVIFFSWIGCYIALYILKAADVLAQPNERSNHTTATPVGGGIAIIASILCFQYVIATPATLLTTALGLAIISFIDDRHGVDIRWRLLIQILAIVLLFLPNGIVATQFDGLVFQGLLPPLYDHLAAAFAMLVFINIFNFMDGIDGMAASETIAIGGGIFLMSFFIEGLRVNGLDGIILAGAAAGFLFLNWHPAKLFMGDVGSVPLGFLLGFFLITLAAEGHWAAALILPAYYLVDGLLTLIRRTLMGEKIWEAHSKHAYQLAVRGGYNHDWVVVRVISLNIILIALAITSSISPELAFYTVTSAYVAAFGLWVHFFTAKKPAEQTIMPPQGSDALSA